jgi:hypothetical protein
MLTAAVQQNRHRMLLRKVIDPEQYRGTATEPSCETFATKDE